MITTVYDAYLQIFFGSSGDKCFASLYKLRAAEDFEEWERSLNGIEYDLFDFKNIDKFFSNFIDENC